jgi:branched-chain amino acid transport system permease protein
VAASLSLRRGSPLRAVLWGLAAAVAILIVTQFVLPGGTGGARGTPASILFAGLVAGALNGLTAIGLVLIYRTSRVINFAQAALGAMGAIFAYNLVIVYHVPYGLAFGAGVVISAAIGAAVELTMRRLFDAPRLVVTIFTIGLASLLGTFGVGLVSQLPIWGQGRNLTTSFGQRPIVPLRSIHFTLGHVHLLFRFAHVLALVVLVVAMIAIGSFLRFTRLGIAIRASAENVERAELLGVNVKILSTVVWTIAGALSGAGLILLGTTQTFSLGGQGAPAVLIAALAAAVVARMRSLPVAVFGALLISVLQESMRWSFQNHGGIVQAALFGVIVIGLLAQRRTLIREQEGSSWEANQELRPAPRELLAIPSVRTWRRVLIGAVGVGILAFPWLGDAGMTNRASYAAIIAMVLLSLVVLTGWAGQVSLGQFGFVAIGAMVGGAVTSRAGLSFWLALPIGAIITTIVALGVGLPALRIRGLFLAVVTLAFASAVSTLLFDERYFPWLQPRNIRRPTLLWFDFEDERSMYYLCLAFLVLTVLLIVSLRRSRTGRVMIALRENENDVQAFGINVIRTKLAVFALSGFICGVAGVLLAHHQRAVGQTAFGPQVSIDVFVFAVIGGVGSVSGALLGSTFQTLSQIFPIGDPILQFFLNASFGLLVILYLAPGGLAAVFYAMRDSIFRIVAQRRQIVVPSLMADYDPAIVERQLVPLGEGTEGSGLEALDPQSRYRLRSALYKESELTTDGRGAPDDRSALGAAAQRAAGED